MNKLERKAQYISELVKAKRFLPGRFYSDIMEALPEKSLNRIKNACSGSVQDAEVLAVIKKLSDKERKRRLKAAETELKAVRA